MGLFDGSGEILWIAGPAGGITAFGIVGIGVMMIMEGIAELIAHWPISNAMFYFVSRFLWIRSLHKFLALHIGELQECLEYVRHSLMDDEDRLAYSVDFATAVLRIWLLNERGRLRFIT